MQLLKNSLKTLVNITVRIRYFITVGALLTIIGGCGGSTGNSNNNNEPGTVEQQLHAALDAANIDTDFTLIVKSHNGTQFTHSRGESTAATTYRSASTAKMVTASVILWLVEQGLISLEDNPQDYLDFWPTTGNHAAIKLRHLLSFTSGLNNEPVCLYLPDAVFLDCIEKILDDNPSIPAPGDEFYYANTHLQIAGLMAIHASGMDNWEQVFDYFKAGTQLFTNASYDYPSPSNPRLGGGMHWQANEYIEFLDALYHQKILSGASVEAMTSDQIGSANIVYSPVSEWPIALDWHYGFGQWIECRSIPFDCISTSRVSSTGAYGAYPFIDFENQYFGIVAREGSLSMAHRGFQLWREVESELAEWAGNNNE
ncbi:serine hydrolase [Simiduia sp. 21SJ11W-1]|uniref:serine hydrolase domain-containing protein n=1 Tax=Simiduia sp. 21SJ11W-1 TaxID=2909669 RepID=UPI00209D0578|nr:serine hydrolase [Simiduia sp. 21SJ11W-1]UTA48484.1 serine hydrolase [Simiduia sp. 21SJ11W-1]